MAKKYICTAECGELDFFHEKHCTTTNLNNIDEVWPDGCPCGNTPIWIEVDGCSCKNNLVNAHDS